MFQPDGVELLLTTESEIEKYGLSIDSGNMTSSLTAWIEDERLYDHFFELEIYATAENEPDWYNITKVKINY